MKLVKGKYRIKMNRRERRFDKLPFKKQLIAWAITEYKHYPATMKSFLRDLSNKNNV